MRKASIVVHIFPEGSSSISPRFKHNVPTSNGGPSSLAEKAVMLRVNALGPGVHRAVVTYTWDDGEIEARLIRVAVKEHREVTYSVEATWRRADGCPPGGS